MANKITYKDLSSWLKVAIIGGFVSISYLVIGFLVGFLEAL